jgi:hypothetical protein
LGGTFAPDLRASERPIAIACLGFATFFPLRPDFSVPFFIALISRSTDLDAFGLYFLPLDFFFAVDFFVAVFFAVDFFAELFLVVLLFFALDFFAPVFLDGIRTFLHSMGST